MTSGFYFHICTCGYNAENPADICTGLIGFFKITKYLKLIMFNNSFSVLIFPKWLMLDFTVIIQVGDFTLEDSFQGSGSSLSL